MTPRRGAEAVQAYGEAAGTSGERLSGLTRWHGRRGSLACKSTGLTCRVSLGETKQGAWEI